MPIRKATDFETLADDFLQIRKQLTFARNKIEVAINQTEGDPYLLTYLLAVQQITNEVENMEKCIPVELQK